MTSHEAQRGPTIAQGRAALAPFEHDAPDVAARPPISREVLRDRWNCATHTAVGDDPTGKQLRLWRVVGDLVDAVARAPRPDADGGGHRDRDGNWVDLQSEICDLIRDRIIERVDELGIAR